MGSFGERMTAPSPHRLSGGAKIILTLIAALVLIAELIRDATLGALLGVVVFLLCVVALFSMPLRVSMLTLTLLVLVLPNPGEGTPTLWSPPLAVTGQAFMNHVNTLDRQGVFGSVPVSCLECFFLVLFVVHLMRKAANASEVRVTPSPAPLLKLAYVSLATTGFVWLRGLLGGGDFGMSLWQVNAVIYLPIVFLLMHASLRGPEDHAALAKVFLWAASYKSLLALFVVLTPEMPLDPRTGKMRSPDYATAHSDSMLFAIATIIVLAQLLERYDRRSLRLALFTLPLFFTGMIANNRRLVWVQIGVVWMIVFLISRASRLKRSIARTVFVLVPALAVYATTGWDSQYGKFYKPVRIVRSIVDAESDGSSMWRELENFNLVATFRAFPFLGTGYGHRYFEMIKMPAVDYSLEFVAPHNSLLGLWGFSGLLGFAGVTMLWVAGNYFATRAYRNAREPEHRVAAIVFFGALPIYLFQCWGDLGLGSWTGVFMMASSICLSGKLAVSIGQWRPHGSHQG
jgi:hypothetical protein